MKTVTPIFLAYAPLLSPDKMKEVKSQKAMKVAYKSDLNNHRFAVHENKSIEDPANWGCDWFGNYE